MSDSNSPEKGELRFFETELRMAEPLDGENVENGADGKKESRTLKGVLVPYGKPAKMRYFTEKFAPGAFTKSLASQENKRALYHHDDKDVLADTDTGMLRLFDSEQQLAAEIDVAETRAGDDAIELVRKKLCKGMSARFQVLDDAWTYDEATDHATRTIKEARLIEATVTSIPAYTDTEIEMRNAESEDVFKAKIAQLRSECRSTPRRDEAARRYRELVVQSHELAA